MARSLKKGPFIMFCVMARLPPYIIELMNFVTNALL
jgi:hypothetical protein